jgi:hypothetical protein
MTLTRSAILAFIDTIRRDIDAHERARLAFIEKIRRDLDELERAARGTSAATPSPTSRTTPTSPPFNPGGPRSKYNTPRPASQRPRRRFSAKSTPVVTKVACDACRDFCWENCPCSCHHTQHAGAVAPR